MIRLLCQTSGETHARRNLIQIAGVIDAVEAQLLQQWGVRYLGFPLRLAVHREDLTEREAAEMIKSLAPPVFGVAITYLYEATEIAAFCHALGARIVQLHGDIERDELKRLKTLDPNITVIKSLIIGMRDHKALEATLRELLPFVHAFITDTLDPKIGASGAELAPMRPVFLNMIQGREYVRLSHGCESTNSSPCQQVCVELRNS